jgi:ADP-ribose pyrophosphatase
LKKEGDAACVFALTADHRVVLARQFRPGPNEIVDELPGGAVNEGETFKETATRELLEETGYTPQEIFAIGSVLQCAYSTTRHQVFVAIGCQKTANQQLDMNEYIEVVLKQIPEFITQLVQGACTDPEAAWMSLYHLGIISTTVEADERTTLSNEGRNDSNL